MLRASSLELANTSLVLLVCAVRWGAVWSVFILYVDTDARVIKGPGASDGLLHGSVLHLRRRVAYQGVHTVAADMTCTFSCDGLRVILLADLLE